MSVSISYSGSHFVWIDHKNPMISKVFTDLQGVYIISSLLE